MVSYAVTPERIRERDGKSQRRVGHAQHIGKPNSKKVHDCDKLLSQLNHGPVSHDTLSEMEVEEIRQQVESFLNGSLTDIEVHTCTTEVISS